MFLDDKIVKMVIENKPQNYEDEVILLTEIINMCKNRVSENLHNDMNDRNILPAIKQVCNLWNSASKTLENKGYTFLKIDGFKKYMLSKPELAKILIPLGL